MFSREEKRKIAAAVEGVLLSLQHPEMPAEKPKFALHVEGKESWSWADIKPNWTYDDAGVVPESSQWNEMDHEENRDAQDTKQRVDQILSRGFQTGEE